MSNMAMSNMVMSYMAMGNMAMRIISMRKMTQYLHTEDTLCNGKIQNKQKIWNTPFLNNITVW